jgi:hypothetical protein
VRSRCAAAFEDAKARKVPPGRRPDEFAADELASELLVTANYADAARADEILAAAALNAACSQRLANTSRGISETHVYAATGAKPLTVAEHLTRLRALTS